MCQIFSYPASCILILDTSYLIVKFIIPNSFHCSPLTNYLKQLDSNPLLSHVFLINLETWKK